MHPRLLLILALLALAAAIGLHLGASFTELPESAIFGAFFWAFGLFFAAMLITIFEQRRSPPGHRVQSPIQALRGIPLRLLVPLGALAAYGLAVGVAETPEGRFRLAELPPVARARAARGFTALTLAFHCVPILILWQACAVRRRRLEGNVALCIAGWPPAARDKLSCLWPTAPSRGCAAASRSNACDASGSRAMAIRSRRGASHSGRWASS